jgi:hypothetical protein
MLLVMEDLCPQDCSEGHHLSGEVSSTGEKRPNIEGPLLRKHVMVHATYSIPDRLWYWDYLEAGYIYADSVSSTLFLLANGQRTILSAILWASPLTLSSSLNRGRLGST